MDYAGNINLCGTDYIGFTEKTNQRDDMMMAAAKKFLANEEKEHINRYNVVEQKPLKSKVAVADRR